jgi:hypothetical protein
MKHLSYEAVQEYKAIYKKEYGKDISDDDAWEQGERLVRLVRECSKIPCKGPATKDNHEELRLALLWKWRVDRPKDQLGYTIDMMKRFWMPAEIVTPRFLRPGFPYRDDPSHRYKVRVSGGLPIF